MKATNKNSKICVFWHDIESIVWFENLRRGKKMETTAKVFSFWSNWLDIYHISFSRNNYMAFLFVSINSELTKNDTHMRWLFDFVLNWQFCDVHIVFCCCFYFEEKTNFPSVVSTAHLIKKVFENFVRQTVDRWFFVFARKKTEKRELQKWNVSLLCKKCKLTKNRFSLVSFVQVNTINRA